MTKKEQLEFLIYKRDYYYERDGMTEGVLEIDRYIKQLQSPVTKLRKHISRATEIVIDDYEYQMDVDTELSLTNQEI